MYNFISSLKGHPGAGISFHLSNWTNLLNVWPDSITEVLYYIVLVFEENVHGTATCMIGARFASGLLSSIYCNHDCYFIGTKIHIH